MSGLSKFIANFSPKKRDLPGSKSGKGNPANKGSAPFPLSFAQQRLWFLDQLVSESAAYTTPLLVQLKGKLNRTALEHGLDKMINRHSSLRTAFIVAQEQPAQIVMSSLQISYPLVKLIDVQGDEQPKKVRQLIAQEVRKPFDLAQLPLMRTTLFQLGEEEYLLLFVFHQIIADRRSQHIFLEDLVACYQSEITGQPVQLPELPLQYQDFTQRQGMQTVSHLAYWKKLLEGAPSVLQMPCDRQRPALQTFQAAHYPLAFSQDQLSMWRTFSKQEGVSLSVTLLAVVNALLFRYTGQDDLVVGIPAHHRTSPDLEGIIGPLSNLLALRVNITGNLTFHQLVQRVNDVVMDARMHQALAFERLIEEFQPERDLSHHPIFQVLVDVQERTRNEFYAPGLILQVLNEVHTTPFDLSFKFLETSVQVEAYLEYSIDLFDKTTMARLAGHLQTLLGECVTHPERCIGELEILTPQERHQQLVEWNNSSMSYPQDTCLHHLIEAQAERSPDAIAAVFEEERITYRELNKRANQLAHYLRKQGVGAEVLVGICVERSLEMLVGLLGILKAGGAYVPLDPTYPSERLAYMLENSRAPVLVTQHHLLGYLPTTNIKVVCLDADRSILECQSENNPISLNVSSNLAYVIYTSGSTGRPKGVQIPHSAVVNFLLTMSHEPGLTANDTLFAVTTLSFDIAGLELFLPLVVGACVVIASREIIASGEVLIGALKRFQVTVMQATPVTWRILLASGWTGDPELKVLCGGEALPLDLVQQLLPRVASFWNMYGPTETTIWSSVCKMDLAQQDFISIGRPIGNTQMYLLDTRLQPLPVGVAGELYIGGNGLARGYLSRPELTAERFLRNPFSDNPEARLYRTGDLARYMPDGRIELIGRIDHQVKIRGFRIELGEIETVLNQHPVVKQAVVVVREDRPGEKRLVAYVVANTNTSASTEVLRQFLEEKLPDYMIPATFVVLDVFPLTPNGKIDRKALPAPGAKNMAYRNTVVPPGTPIEKRLIEIVAPLLHLEPVQVGIESNFFLVGGNSLMGTQFVARIAATFGIHLPLRMLFNAPTVRQLAKEIECLIIAKIEAMSDEEAQRLLEQRRSS